jgi:geranylgeranyl diphosphate synthase type II
VFGEAIAILAGDALLTQAFHLMAGAPAEDSAERERRLRGLAILADAAGVNGMVGGQVVDVESEGRPGGEKVLDYIHEHKTGALIRAAAELGALLGGGGEDDIVRLADYGRKIGLAFQIVDDILDVEGSAETLGKSAGKDEKAGKVTYPSVHGLEAARQRAKELTEEAVQLVVPYKDASKPLDCLAHHITGRRS